MPSQSTGSRTLALGALFLVALCVLGYYTLFLTNISWFKKTYDLQVHFEDLNGLLKLIDDYDIDGYLPKAELTSSRLYSAVRTAIRAWEQLVALERHRHFLSSINDCAISLRTYDDVEISLGRILDTVVAICPTHQAVLSLETFDGSGNPQRIIIHQSTHPDPKAAEAAAIEQAQRLYLDPDAMTQEQIGAVEGGLLMPIRLHRELGYGWIFLADVAPDDLLVKVLPIMSAHAANALYGSVAQAMLAKREGNLFDDIAI